MARKIFCQVTCKWIELQDKCQRVVSFSPSVSDSIISMGLGDILKGISVYCVHPDESIRQDRVIVGSYSSYKKDLLHKINPDIIFTTTGYQLDFARELSEYFPVYALRLPVTLSDLIATCAEVGLICGYPQKSSELQRGLLNFASQYILRENLLKKIKVYVEIDLGGPVTFGTYSYITDTLNLLGFENIFGNHPFEWLKPDDNFIKENEPDLILYEPKMFSRSRDIKKITAFLSERLGNVKALTEGKVFITPGIYDFLAHHGPSFIYKVLPFLSELRKSFLKSDL